MNKHEEAAKVLHNRGYNCAQSFLCSYAEELNINENDLFKMAEGLGRGVAGLEKMCCVPIVMSMIVSYLETSDGDGENPKSKLKTYACAKSLAMDFKESIGTLCCKDILDENKKMNGKRCCTDIILKGIEILDECIEEQ